MSQILEMLAIGVVILTTLFVLTAVMQPLMRQQVMVMRLRRNMRDIDVVVVDWKRQLDKR